VRDRDVYSHHSPLLKFPTIVEMTLDELDEVLVIEHYSFATPWSRNLFLQELRSPSSKMFIAKAEYQGAQKVLGYLSLWFVSEEVHILNLASHPEWRRRGIASALLDHGVTLSREQGVERAFLEVRRSNDAALSLYRKYGFTPVGVRKGYYSDTKEDAIVMMREMSSTPLFTQMPSPRPR